MSVLTPNSCQVTYTEIIQPRNNLYPVSNVGWCYFLLKSSGYGLEQRKTNSKSIYQRGVKNKRREIAVHASLWPHLNKPSVIEMEAIVDCDHLDLVLQQANERGQAIIIDWMANWCRKCIYLKPKLEKMAAEYDTKIKFYCVDVNNVPQALVKRGNITKMPTIQLWKDGEMKAEVIGGHKAWLVMDEVREMIQQFL